MASPYEAQIWGYLMDKIGNAYGVAGLMGNLYAESHLYPNIVQGDVPISNFSVEYTAKVDNGTISKDEFCNNGPNGGGYGLAQWTYPARKKALYEMYRQNAKYNSIGSINLALDYLMVELETTYDDILYTLKTASDIRTASDTVLHDFENPADQSTAVEEYRESLGIGYYNTYSGSDPILPAPDTPVAPDNPDPEPTKRKNTLSKLLLFAIATDY